MVENQANTPQQKLSYREVVFRKLSSLINLLRNSVISAGYVGIRDFLIPLFIDYFKDIQPE